MPSVLPRRVITAPAINSSHSTQTTPTSATSRVNSSSSTFDTPVYVSHRRKGSFGTPTHRHKASNGSRDFNAAELIAPSVPRAEMVLTAPVVQQQIHNEPLTDVLFTQYAVYSARCLLPENTRASRKRALLHIPDHGQGCLRD